MNKPIGEGRTEKPAPVILMPKPPPVKRRRRFPRIWLLGSLLSLAVLAAIATTWWLTNRSGAARYATAPVTRGDVIRTVMATGTVNPVLTIIVGSYVSGVIQEISCDYNTKVTKGQVCAKIDPRPYQTIVDQSKANLIQAKAQLEKDKASLAYAQLSYDRNAHLAQTNIVSKDVADNARSVLNQAKAQLGVDQAAIEQRQAQLEAAQVNLDYTNIVSPVDGTVVSRNVTVGQTVAASFQTPTLFLIATDLTHMQVDTNVSESDIGGIKEGNDSTFTVDAFPKRIFSGKVSQVRQSPQTIQNVVTFDVVIGVDNSDGALKPGMTAATRIIVDRRKDVLRVPNEAFRYSPARSSIATQSNASSQRGGAQANLWVLHDGAAIRVPVTTGLADDTHTEIVNGDLRAGDQIIIAEQHQAAKTVLPPPRL
jgi:HlyD family secretion protein